MGEKANSDVVIVGGGPAGLSALQWCIDLGMSVVMIEKEADLGGQLLNTFNPIRNYLGIETASGRELRDIFVRHLADGGAAGLVGKEVVEADLAEKSIMTSDGSRYYGRAIIIATGVRRKELHIPGERDLLGRGVLVSGAKQRNEVLGKRVAIVGGGDAALENALALSETAKKVFVIHRRNTFSGRRYFLDELSQRENVEFVAETKAIGINGSDMVTAVELEDIKTGSRQMLAADAVLIRIGVIPNTELFRGHIEMDEAGYIAVDANCRTSVPDVFAVGDAANPAAPTIAAAVGHGSIAAKAVGGQLRGPSSRQ